MNAPVTIEITPEAQALATQANVELATARQYQITTSDDYEAAGDELRRLKTMETTVEAKRVAMKKPALDACRVVDDFFRPALDDLAAARKAVEQARSAFRAEQEKIRAEAQRKAEEAARKDRERLAAKAAAIDETARLEREKREAAIQAAEASGRAEKAAAMREAADAKEVQQRRDAEASRLAAASVPTAPVVSGWLPKSAGVSAPRRNYFAVVEGKRALIAAIAAGTVPEAAFTPNQTFLNQQARSLKDELRYPGVEVYYTESESARTA